MITCTLLFKSIKSECQSLSMTPIWEPDDILPALLLNPWCRKVSAQKVNFEPDGSPRASPRQFAFTTQVFLQSLFPSRTWMKQHPPKISVVNLQHSWTKRSMSQPVSSRRGIKIAPLNDKEKNSTYGNRHPSLLDRRGDEAWNGACCVVHWWQHTSKEVRTDKARKCTWKYVKSPAKHSYHFLWKMICATESVMTRHMTSSAGQSVKGRKEKKLMLAA